MKVRELFEGYNSEDFDVAVEYELEYTTPEGEVDYKMLEISGVVTITSDMYGTGDSPEGYEFNVDSIVEVETGNRLPLSVIPKDAWKDIDTQAYEKVSRRR